MKMYKGLVVIIILFFVLSIIIGQCSSDDELCIDENTEKIELSEKLIEQPIIQSEQSDSSLITKTRMDLGSIDDTLFIKEQNIGECPGWEIPKVYDAMPEQILKREGYTLSYNNITKCANWVDWHLPKEHTDGSWSRKGLPYFEDMEAVSPRQEVWDWKINPNRYDHGHMCPAGDNKWSKLAMEQSFLLTNMCPQNRKLNGGDWKELEEKCRDWANEYGSIYIVCGPIFYDGKKECIGGSKEIWVPDAFYKVVLCLEVVPKAIGFIYPNIGTHHPMSYYVLPVNDVEAKTGIDFFYTLPDDLEESIEEEADLFLW